MNNSLHGNRLECAEDDEEMFMLILGFCLFLGVWGIAAMTYPDLVAIGIGLAAYGFWMLLFYIGFWEIFY